MKKISFVALASVLALTAAGQSLAQAAKPAAAPVAPQAATPTPPTFGAPAPGQCVIDTNLVVNNSAMGKSASERLVQIGAQVDAELSPEGEALETEKNALQATARSNPTGPAKTTFEGKVTAFQKKAEAFQQKVQLRKAEMQYTSQAVQQALYSRAIPYINTVVTQKGCSMVVEAGSLLHYEAAGANDESTTFTYVNPAMDLTTTVVQKMDASNEQLPQFERVHLDQQQQAAQGAAPAKK